MLRLRPFGLSLAGILLTLPAYAAAPLETAQLDFYNARYELSAAATLEACATGGDIAACELRTAALLFQKSSGWSARPRTKTRRGRPAPPAPS